MGRGAGRDLGYWLKGEGFGDFGLDILAVSYAQAFKLAEGDGAAARRERRRICEMFSPEALDWLHRAGCISWNPRRVQCDGGEAGPVQAGQVILIGGRVFRVGGEDGQGTGAG